MQVSSNADSTGYHVEATPAFASSYSAVSACRNATSAFASTVQNLLSQVVNNAEFAKLVGRTQGALNDRSAPASIEARRF